MPKYEMGLQDYLRVIKKRFWIILFTAIAVYVFSLVYTQLQVKIYEAHATVELIRRTTIGGVFEGALLHYGDALSTAEEVIRSSRVISKVVEMLQAQGRLKTVDGDEKQEQIQQIKGMVSASQMARANILVISVKNSEPELAKAIANAVAVVFSAEDQTADAQQNQAMRLHLEEQKAVVEAALLDAERNLEDFNKQHGLLGFSESERVDLEHIATLETKYRESAAWREQSELRLKTLQSSLDPASLQTMDIGELLNDNSVRERYNKVIELNSRLAEMLEEYTPRHPAIIDLENQIEDEKKKLAMLIRPVLSMRVKEVEDELGHYASEEERLQAQLNQEQSRLNYLPEIRLKLAQLRRRVEVNKQLFMTFTERLEEMKIAEASKVGGVRILDRAISAVLIYPKSSTNAMAGLIIGILLGLAFAFVIESMDTSIGTIEDVEAYTEKPVLGVIPLINVEEEKLSRFQKKVVAEKEEFSERQAKLVAISDPKSPVTEAFRTLRTNLQFSFLQKAKGKTLLITSATPQEGKTTTITNMAVIFAQAGKKTAILSCNLRHPTVYKILGLKKKPGVTDILVGSLPWQEALQDPGIDNLQVLTAGPYPPNPSELLDSPQYARLLDELKQTFDVILIDSPPVLPVTDAAIVGSKVDGVLMVYFAGKAAREALLRAKIQLENVNSNILGVVLNRIQPEGKLGYTYYYHYQYKYYGPKEPAV